MSSQEETTTRSDIPVVPAEDWLSQGRRVLCDPVTKRIVSKKSESTVYIWERIVAPFEVCSQSRWLTFLPSPPEGSYGYSKIDGLLQTAPRLYVEHVGMGDSDKPNKYDYAGVTTMDRANQIEAQWKKHKIRRTVLVSMGCSSMTMMELLNRQTSRLSLGLPLRTRIEHVLCINGGYFANAHTPHPLNACPIARKVATAAGQHSNLILDSILKPCFSKEYNVSKQELREMEKIIRRYNGMSFFSSKASKYVEEHKKHSQRWDLVNVYYMTRRQGVSFTIVGSEQDRFEPKSFAMVKERLSAASDVYIETLPGGYKLDLENPRRLADLIDGVAMAPAYDETRVSASCSSVHKRSSMSSVSDTSTLSTMSVGSSTYVLDEGFGLAF